MAADSTPDDRAAAAETGGDRATLHGEAAVTRQLSLAIARLRELEAQELVAYGERGEFLATFPTDPALIANARREFEARLVGLKREQRDELARIESLREQLARGQRANLRDMTRDDSRRICALMYQSVGTTAPAFERAWNEVEAAALALIKEGQQIEVLAATVLGVRHAEQIERAHQLHLQVAPHASGRGQQVALAVLQRIRRLVEILGSDYLNEHVRIDDSTREAVSIPVARQRDARIVLGMFEEGNTE